MKQDERQAFTQHVRDTGGWTDADGIIADTINDAVTAGLLTIPASRIGERNTKLWIAARRIAEAIDATCPRPQEPRP